MVIVESLPKPKMDALTSKNGITLRRGRRTQVKKNPITDSNGKADS